MFHVKHTSNPLPFQATHTRPAGQPCPLAQARRRAAKPRAKFAITLGRFRMRAVWLASAAFCFTAGAARRVDRVVVRFIA